jgi:hypothetical protein
LTLCTGEWHGEFDEDRISREQVWLDANTIAM